MWCVGDDRLRRDLRFGFMRMFDTALTLRREVVELGPNGVNFGGIFARHVHILDQKILDMSILEEHV